ncbi:hypothetical protein XM38_043800 [Halomicronema hongdechloris C2206]|uniref:Uncharacterized protein n=1 Tax=Halomicronema hongdechloris C2206 TaxID=1641165 RepID=A0A1Z3HSX5_9CYAN|nr:hypothetical protein XM38_043800 [Halomicronema hongdechloris C2206]
MVGFVLVVLIRTPHRQGNSHLAGADLRGAPEYALA